MRVADGDVAGEPAPRRRRRVGESESGTETVAELLELHAAIRLRRPLRRRERRRGRRRVDRARRLFASSRAEAFLPVWKSKFYGAFRRDACSMAW